MILGGPSSSCNCSTFSQISHRSLTFQVIHIRSCSLLLAINESTLVEQFHLVPGMDREPDDKSLCEQRQPWDCDHDHSSWTAPLPDQSMEGEKVLAEAIQEGLGLVYPTVLVALMAGYAANTRLVWYESIVICPICMQTYGTIDGCPRCWKTVFSDNQKVFTAIIRYFADRHGSRTKKTPFE